MADKFDEDFEVVYGTLEKIVAEMEEEGFDPHSINAALLALFAERMYQNNDREMFEQILEDALAEEWPTHTLH